MSAADELALITAEHGGALPARAVVDWAREHPESALHARFDWEDSEAAEKWRVHQARQIIATVRIEPHPHCETREYVSLEVDRCSDAPVYLPTVVVLADPTKRAQLLAQVVAELRRMRQRHRVLVELADVWAAIDRAS